MNSKRVLQRAIGLIIVVWLMAGCGSASSEPTPAPTPVPPTPTPAPPTPTPVPPTPTPILKGLVDVGGYSLNIQCKGEGSPTVIFEPDFSMPGDDWAIIQSKVGELTRACYYDRAGQGESDPCPKAAYTTQDMVDDLHKLLDHANIAGPYVLVVHAMGAFNARLYASQYPQDVAGMVLIDPSHPDRIEHALALFPSESPDDGARLRSEREFWAGGYVDYFMGMGVSAEALAAGGRRAEFVDYDTSMAQVRATGSLGSIPLIVLSADQWQPQPGFPPELTESLYQDWVQLHEDLAALSSNGTHIIVEDSGHLIHWDQWEFVVDTIDGVVMEVQGK